MNNASIFCLIWLKFWFDSNFEKKIVFESSVLAWILIRIRIQNWIRIRIAQKSWIRIRIEAIRIHNPDKDDLKKFNNNECLRRKHQPASPTLDTLSL
jgi:hypothetical protein